MEGKKRWRPTSDGDIISPILVNHGLASLANPDLPIAGLSPLPARRSRHRTAEESGDSEQRLPRASPHEGVAQHSSALSRHVAQPDMPCPSPLRSVRERDDEPLFCDASNSTEGDDDDEDALSAALLQGELREVLCDHRRALRQAAERHEAAMRLGADAVLEALGRDLASLLRDGAVLQQPQPARRGEDREHQPPEPSADHPGRAWEPGRRRTSAEADQGAQSWAAGDVRHVRPTKSIETSCSKTSASDYARRAMHVFAGSRGNTADFDGPTRRDVLGGSALDDPDSFKKASTPSSFEFAFPARVNELVESFSNGRSQRDGSPRRGVLADIVNSMSFNVTGNLVIFVNSALIVHAANLRIHDDSDSPPLAIAELCFTGWYVLELLLKLVVHRSSYFTGQDRGFNVVDLMLVILSVLEVSLMVFGAWGMITLDSSFLRTLRVFKVAKVLRMFRALRMFNEIRLMMDCVVQSVGPFLWAMALLAFLTSLFAVLLVQSLGSALDQGGLTVPEEEALLMYFGSVKVAMFSLLQAQSGGKDWMEIYDHVQPLGLLSQTAFVFYIMLMMIAVMNIVASVYLDKAMQVAKPTLENMMLDKHIQDMEDAKELTDMVSEMDTRNAGHITFGDFMHYMKDEKFRLYFDVRGLNVKDTTMFFKMLSSASRNGETSGETEEEESVDLKAFVMGCMRLKGVASCMDLYTVSWEIKILRAQQSRFMEWAAENFSAPPAARHRSGAQAVHACPTVDV